MGKFLVYAIVVGLPWLFAGVSLIIIIILSMAAHRGQLAASVPASFAIYTALFTAGHMYIIYRRNYIDAIFRHHLQRKAMKRAKEESEKTIETTEITK